MKFSIKDGDLKTVFYRPVFELNDDKTIATLTEDYVYYIRYIQKTIWISKGFQWDGFSIPTIARPLMGKPFNQRSQVPGLLHDGLYRCQLTGRETTDAIFIDEMDKWDFWWWRRNLMWAAVRTGGWVAWDSYDELDIQNSQEFIKFKL